MSAIEWPAYYEQLRRIPHWHTRLKEIYLDDALFTRAGSLNGVVLFVWAQPSTRRIYQLKVQEEAPHDEEFTLQVREARWAGSEQETSVINPLAIACSYLTCVEAFRTAMQRSITIVDSTLTTLDRPSELDPEALSALSIPDEVDAFESEPDPEPDPEPSPVPDRLLLAEDCEAFQMVDGSLEVEYINDHDEPQTFSLSADETEALRHWLNQWRYVEIRG